VSWGYFADLDISLPTEAWAQRRTRKPTEIALAAGWSGLRDKGLEAAFGRPNTREETFAKVVGWACYKSGDALHRIEREGERTRIRLCLLCDKSLLDLAYPLATLFEAARAEGGSPSARARSWSAPALSGSRSVATVVNPDFARSTAVESPMPDEAPSLRGPVHRHASARPMISATHSASACLTPAPDQLRSPAARVSGAPLGRSRMGRQVADGRVDDRRICNLPRRRGPCLPRLNEDSSPDVREAFLSPE
jgi:hypothetical protein